MSRTAMLREVRMEAFERVHELWRRKRLVQAQAAGLLKMSERTFRRWVARYEAEGPAALRDRRLGRSARRAPPEEVAAVEALYGAGHRDWNVRHFYDEVYVTEGGSRSYTWVKNRLQKAGLVKKGRRRGPHRERRERKPAAGMMLHQDASTHEWVPGESWDLVVTMDDATGEVPSGFFVVEEGTWSSLRGVVEVVEAKGLFDSLYTDRGSHYWHTPKAGGKVDRDRPTRFGRAMKELGIGMIAAYSPQARGRSARVFGTPQGRLPQGAEAGGDLGDRGGERVPEGVPAALQRGVLGGAEGGGVRLRAAAAVDADEAARHPVPEGGADGGQRQLRRLPRKEAADCQAAPPVPLRAGQGDGPRV